MIDIGTSRVVDIIESRETADVTEWLRSYPNIEVVSRDGSVMYAKAIEEAHPEAIQISDRFHLLKNLTDAAKSHITGILGAKFRIAATTAQENITEGYFAAPEQLPPTLAERIHNTSTERKQAVVDRVRELVAAGYRTAAISQEVGIGYGTAKKIPTQTTTLPA